MAPRVDLPAPLGRIDIPPNWRKRCSVNHWGWGVEVAATPVYDDGSVRWTFMEMPVGVASDGDGGAFVLSISTEAWAISTQGLATLRHVAATGVAGPILELTLRNWWPGIIGQWADYAVVASGRGRAILAGFDYQRRMTAQRYDASATPLWRPRLGVRLSSGFALNATGNFVGLVGEEDGKGGAIFAWREPAAGGTSEIRAQRVSRTGSLRWGTLAPRIAPVAGSQFPPPQPWIQLVATPKGGAIVVALESSGAAYRVVATPVGPTGTVGAPTTLVASIDDDWKAHHRLRYAVTDGAGGSFLAYVDAGGAVRLLRYTPGTGVNWSIATGLAIDPATLAVHEDGRGGVLVAGVGGFPSALRVRRYDANGAVTFDALDGATVPTAAGAGPYGRDWSSRHVIPLPDGTGGAIVMVNELSSARGPTPVVTRCFDANGALVSPATPLNASDWGHLTPRAAVVGVQRAVVAYTQYDDLPSLGDVSAQRVGCCVPQGEPPPLPPFGCEILPLPELVPGRFAFQLPCGNRERGFGVLPLSTFVTRLRGLRAPTGLASHDVPPPAWARLVLRNVPEGIAVSLVTLDGKPVASAKPLRGFPGAQTLAFAPPKEADLLLVVSREGAGSRDAEFAFDVSLEHGDGPAPAPVQRRTARKGRSARR